MMKVLWLNVGREYVVVGAQFMENKGFITYRIQHTTKELYHL